MLNIYLETDVTYLDPRVKGHFALHNHINGISVLKKKKFKKVRPYKAYETTHWR